MRVQRVVLPEDQGVSWTVLGAEHGPIAPIESWLSHLSNVGRSPNTQKAYATDLKDYFQFGSSGMNVGDRALWPLVSPCRATVLGWTGRAATCTRSSRPPSNPARAAMTKRSAFGALPS